MDNAVVPQELCGHGIKKQWLILDMVKLSFRWCLELVGKILNIVWFASSFWLHLGRYSMLTTYLFQLPPKILIVDFQIGGNTRMVLCGEYKDVHVIGPLDLSIFISEMAFVQEMLLYITCGHPSDTHTHTHICNS